MSESVSPSGIPATASTQPVARATSVSKTPNAPAVAQSAAATLPDKGAAGKAVSSPTSKSPTGSTDASAQPPDGEMPGRRRFFLASGQIRLALSTWVSLIVHAVLIIVLGLYMIDLPKKSELKDLTAVIPDRPDELLNEVLDTTITPTEQLALTSSSAAPVSGTGGGGGEGAIVGTSAPSYDKSVGSAPEGPSMPIGDIGDFSSGGNHYAMDLPDGTLGEPSAVVDNYQQAMDRITQEILNMLAKNKVLVIWCFDESESMKDDQKEIRDRIDKVYVELGLAESAQGDALLTAVTSYGEGFHVHTAKPTSDIERIREAIGSVPVDESGKEIMSMAVGKSIASFHKYATSGRRQLALILVTDESGDETDNYEHLEAAIKEARDTRCVIYTLGREAVFGYPYVFMNWVDPKTEINFWLQIDRGPETPYPEQLQIDGFTRRWDAHPSGFGPYEQVRMARQTGGVFFMLPSPEVNLVARDDRKYEIEAMRPYLPDLGPRLDYARERDESELRTTLWKIITDLNPYNPKASPYCTVQVTFPIAPQEFVKAALANQKTALGMLQYYEQAEKAMEKLKPLRNREYTPRWRANYDLMYAQIITYKVRIYEYGAYLEAFMKQPKLIKNPLGATKKTTHWDIRTRAETMTEDKTKDYVIMAKRMLEDVIKEHAGTPWAARAQWELARGFGVELIEAFYDPRRGDVKVPKL